MYGIANGPCGTTQRKVVTLTNNCNEPGQHLTEFMVTASDNCTRVDYRISSDVNNCQLKVCIIARTKREIDSN